jgi:hypothetical protein
MRDRAKREPKNDFKSYLNLINRIISKSSFKTKSLKAEFFELE